MYSQKQSLVPYYTLPSRDMVLKPELTPTLCCLHQRRAQSSLPYTAPACVLNLYLPLSLARFS